MKSTKKTRSINSGSSFLLLLLLTCFKFKVFNNIFIIIVPNKRKLQFRKLWFWKFVLFREGGGII